jgi:hypothetical protein
MRSRLRRLNDRAATLAFLFLATGCAQSYRNVEHPDYGPSDFDRDSSECRRENSHPTVTTGMYGGVPQSEIIVDEAMVKRCLTARGWRQ